MRSGGEVSRRQLGLKCAQRLSASTIPAPACARAINCSCTATGAQRLSASTIPAQDFPGMVEDWIWQCSTPFGINDSCTQRPAARGSGHPSVLNAFRHQRFLHPSRWTWASSPTVSAQRLSASTIPAPDVLQVRFQRHGVLNAFRHQRFLHLPPERRARMVSLFGAQRLSASTIPALVLVLWRPRALACAQRLSASTIPAPATSTVVAGLV